MEQYIHFALAVEDLSELCEALIRLRRQPESSIVSVKSIYEAIQSSVLSLENDRHRLAIMMAFLAANNAREVGIPAFPSHGEQVRSEKKKKKKTFDSRDFKFEEFRPGLYHDVSDKMNPTIPGNGDDEQKDLDFALALLNEMHCMRHSQQPTLELCLWAAERACSLEPEYCTKVIPVISNHIARFAEIEESAMVLNSLHQCYLRVCLRAGHVRLAYESLGIIMTDVNSQLCTAVDVLQYFYMAGKVCTNMELWSKASHYYTVCTSLPIPSATPVGNIITAAYQGRVLTFLLHSGKAPHFLKEAENGYRIRSSEHILEEPSFSSLSKSVRDALKPYKLLANAFEDSYSSLSSCITVMANAFIDDGNMQLVKRLPEVFRHFQVQRFQRIYSSISIEDFSEKIGFKESVDGDLLKAKRKSINLIKDMLDSGKLHGVRINTKLSMIYFGQRKLESTRYSKMVSPRQRMLTMLDTLRKVDLQASKNQEYVDHCVSKRFAHTIGNDAVS